MQWISELRRKEGLRASVVTQFVVGAVGDTDLELLHTSDHLYNQLGLRRTYFMAFNPVIQTPFESLAPVSHQREFRLYQASFLLRDYGWNLEDMPFLQDGNLPVDIDPKLAWAKENLRETPVEVNRAEREELLRVPGIGPKGAAAILAARRRARLRSVGDLRQIGVRTKDIEPFVLLDGQRPVYQLKLFT